MSRLCPQRPGGGGCTWGTRYCSSHRAGFHRQRHRSRHRNFCRKCYRRSHNSHHRLPPQPPATPPSVPSPPASGPPPTKHNCFSSVRQTSAWLAGPTRAPTRANGHREPCPSQRSSFDYVGTVGQRRRNCRTASTQQVQLKNFAPVQRESFANQLRVVRPMRHHRPRFGARKWGAMFLASRTRALPKWGSSQQACM